MRKAIYRLMYNLALAIGQLTIPLLLFIIMMRFFIFLSIASFASPFQAHLSVVRQSRRNIIISAATQNGSSDETKMSNVDEYRNAPTVSMMCVYTYIYCLWTT